MKEPLLFLEVHYGDNDITIIDPFRDNLQATADTYADALRALADKIEEDAVYQKKRRDNEHLKEQKYIKEIADSREEAKRGDVIEL